MWLLDLPPALLEELFISWSLVYPIDKLLGRSDKVLLWKVLCPACPFRQVYLAKEICFPSLDEEREMEVTVMSMENVAIFAVLSSRLKCDGIEDEVEEEDVRNTDLRNKDNAEVLRDFMNSGTDEEEIGDDDDSEYNSSDASIDENDDESDETSEGSNGDQKHFFLFHTVELTDLNLQYPYDSSELQPVEDENWESEPDVTIIPAVPEVVLLTIFNVVGAMEHLRLGFIPDSIYSVTGLEEVPESFEISLRDNKAVVEGAEFAANLQKHSPSDLTLSHKGQKLLTLSTEDMIAVTVYDKHCGDVFFTTIRDIELMDAVDDARATASNEASIDIDDELTWPVTCMLPIQDAIWLADRHNLIAELPCTVDNWETLALDCFPRATNGAYHCFTESDRIVWQVTPKTRMVINVDSMPYANRSEIASKFRNYYVEWLIKKEIQGLKAEIDRLQGK